jgi:hypothetical protein
MQMTKKHQAISIGTRAIRHVPMIFGVALILSSSASTALAVVDTPEISADAMGSALALLAGGVLLLTRRVSSNSQLKE